MYAHILQHVLSRTSALGSSAQQASTMIEAAAFPKPARMVPAKKMPTGAAVPRGTVVKDLPPPAKKTPVQPVGPPPAHVLMGQSEASAASVAKDEDVDDDVPHDAVGVAELVEEIIDSDEKDGKLDPCAVRFKNIRQFCDKLVFEAWLTQYFNLPADGHVMK